MIFKGGGSRARGEHTRRWPSPNSEHVALNEVERNRREAAY
jgi:hypothetical protein